MEELYKAIEQKIKEAGCPIKLSGEDIYNDICDQIDEKENGTYLLLSKFQENIVLEYNITIMNEEFNLSVLTVRTPEKEYKINFDEE